MNIANEKKDDKTPSNLKNTILLAIYSGLIIIAFLITIGFLIAHFSHDDHSMSVTGIAALCGLISTNILLAYAIIRTHKGRYKDPEALTPREKLNRNILLFSGFIGIVISISLAVFGEGVGDDANVILSNSPIPIFLAIILAIIWAVLMPITVFFWEKKATDEQEIYAYRTGAYYAAYAYLIGAPTWWILWRGGLVPEPNGMIIFIIFNFIWLGIWLWKKYRG